MAESAPDTVHIPIRRFAICHRAVGRPRVIPDLCGFTRRPNFLGRKFHYYYYY